MFDMLGGKSGRQRILARIAVAMSLAMFGACVPEDMVEKIADDEKERIARDYIQRMVDGDIAGLVVELEPKARTGGETEALEQMRALFPKETPAVTNLVGYYTVHRIGDGTEYTLSYQFGYESSWWVVTTAWREMPDGTRSLTALTANQLKVSLQEANAFSFKRATVRHYLILAGAVLIPVFILTTLVACIRTKISKRKWLWIIFILFGFVQFSLNWTTGDIGLRPISIVLFGASAMTSSAYSPWMISFALPIGAIIFWLRRNNLQEAKNPSAAPPDVS